MSSEATRYKKGQAQGRPTGVKNKLTRTIRDTFLEVFQKAQTDPKLAKYSLEALLKKDMRIFYSICGRIIPQEIIATVDHTVIWNEEIMTENQVIDITHEVIKETGDSPQSATG
jgi:hypothetical protein